MRYYRLDGRDVVPATMEETMPMFEDIGARTIARNEVGAICVSTVFLVIDHNFGDGPPLVFETMIFGGPCDQEQWRYATYDEAEAGHRAAVERMLATV